MSDKQFEHWYCQYFEVDLLTKNFVSPPLLLFIDKDGGTKRIKSEDAQEYVNQIKKIIKDGFVADGLKALLNHFELIASLKNNNVK